jgi:hypothetical protein
MRASEKRGISIYRRIRRRRAAGHEAEGHPLRLSIKGCLFPIKGYLLDKKWAAKCLERSRATKLQEDCPYRIP